MDEKYNTRFRDITTKPVIGLLFRMAIPSMIGMLINAIYNMTDTYFIGKMGNVSFTASIGIIFTFVSLLQAVGFWFGYGSGNYMSRKLGQSQMEKAEEMASTGFYLAVMTGCIIMFVGELLCEPMVILLGGNVTDELFQACLSYLRILLFSAPFSLGATVLYNQMRLTGNAKDGMLGMLTGMLVNMILDPVLILYCNLAVAGAAIATTVGQIVGFCILFLLTTKNGNIRIKWQCCSFCKEYVEQMLAGGAPNFCRQGITSVAGILLNVVAGSYGESMVAAISISGRVISMCYALVIGFGQGYQPICGINYGAGLWNRVKKGFWISLGIATGILMMGMVLLLFSAKQLVRQFTIDEETITLCCQILRLQSMVFPFMGIYTLAGMFLQNTGRFLAATLVTVAEKGLFFIPAVVIMPLGWGKEGLLWSQPVASFFACMFSIYMLRKNWRKVWNNF